MSKLLVILGPTATGKTDLALNLAKKFNGELVSCDSRQVYKGLDIGTGKMPGIELSSKNYELSMKKKKNYWEINGVKIWMYDVVSPKKQYNVADYVRDANKVRSEIVKRDKLPIVVGGTGLYLKALLEDLFNLSIPVDLNLRKKLEKLSLKKLQEKLQKNSPHRWNLMNSSDRENPRRLIRAIELTTHLPIPLKITTPRTVWYMARNAVLKIGLTAPREILYKRVNERVRNRINQGMIEEAKRLHKNGLTLKRMKELGLEYGVLADFLDGKIRDNNVQNKHSLLARKLASKIHGYVRRQLTWFKKEEQVNWFDITDKDYIKSIEKLVTSWYYYSHDQKN